MTSPVTHEKKTAQDDRYIKLFDCSHHLTVYRAMIILLYPQSQPKQRLGRKSGKFLKAKPEFPTPNTALLHTKNVMDEPRCCSLLSLTAPQPLCLSPMGLACPNISCSHTVWSRPHCYTSSPHGQCSPRFVLSEIVPETMWSMHSNTMSRYYK